MDDRMDVTNKCPENSKILSEHELKPPPSRLPITRPMIIFIAAPTVQSNNSEKKFSPVFFSSDWGVGFDWDAWVEMID